ISRARCPARWYSCTRVWWRSRGRPSRSSPTRKRHAANNSCPAITNGATRRQNYKKILLAAVATLAFGTQAVAADKLKIGTEGAYPPFNLIDASGKVGGFDVEIAQALCAKMGAECEVVTSDWDGIIPALNAKKFDFLAASMSITEERKQAVDFTEPYYTNKLQFIAPKGSDFKTDKASLKGKVIGAQRATIAGTWLEDNLADTVEIKLYDTQ